MEYPEAFEAWAKHNPWMQENKEEAYQLWIRNGGWKYFKKSRPKKAAKKKAARPPKKKRWKRKSKKSPAKKKRRSGVKYYRYIKSTEWIEKSRKWREETGACEMCGATDSLQCHHLHYRTVGKETREDIMVVCYECHCKLHGVDKFE